MFKQSENKESGSIMIEATISLSAFMFAIVTILTIVNICIVQARMSYAINTTAKEISQYSYLYALTGLNESQSGLNQAGSEDVVPLDNLFTDINETYNEIEKMGNSGLTSPSNVQDIENAWNSISQSVQNGAAAIESDIEAIAEDPKQIIFGVAKLAGSGAMDLAKSKLVMEPLARAMCKKHLVSEKGENVDKFLKSLGVVPNATGSHYKGVSFEGSTLFPNGTNEIKVCVSYDVKIIALLPLDFTFHFEQTAITQGWPAGEESFKEKAERPQEYAENNTLWTQATPTERAEYIRNLAFKDLKAQGYEVLAYPYNTDGILYSEEKKEFVMPRSWNPFGTEDNMTVDALNENVMQSYIEHLCGTMNSNEFGSTVTVKRENKKDGSTTKKNVSCEDATKRIIITIPEDPGLEEKIKQVIAKSDTDGVEIELVKNYGNGAKQSVVDNNAQSEGDGPK